MRGEVPAAVENTVRWCDAVCRSDGLATRFIDGLGAVLGEEEIERVAAPNRVREADFGTALLVHGRLPPASVQLRPWHRDRRLKEMVNGAQATGLTPAPPPAPPPAPVPEPAREGHMSDEPEQGGELPAEWPSDVIGAEEAGVFVFRVSADTMQGLVDASRSSSAST